MLQLVALYDNVIEVSTKLLRHPISFEKIHFTLGDALGVPLILLGGYFFASAFTFLLKNVGTSKIAFAAWCALRHFYNNYYVLLFLVVLAALSGAGIELTSLPCSPGALGVGLGFGLQNIVNNFVSGFDSARRAAHSRRGYCGRRRVGWHCSPDRRTLQHSRNISGC